MPLQEKADQELSLGIYFHIPFCARQCDFCAFYQEPPRRGDLERYLAGMEQELSRLDIPRPVDTVFWGGGTPGLLSAHDLGRLGQAMLRCLPQAPEEWTVEMAPSTVKADKVDVLRDMGVTRISMGVQSFREDLLDKLGRQHSPRQIYQAIDIIRSAGVKNLNLDLIFAIPGQSAGMWEEDLKEAVRCAPEHVSTYCLTFEEDTALYLRLSRGVVEKQSEQDEAAFYETSWRVLEEAGYAQYEISNYARPGFACQHNIHTWEMHEWIGCGPSAASQYAGRRHTHVPSLDAWLKGLEAGTPDLVDVQDLTPELLYADALIFGLRMNQGVNLKVLSERFPEASGEILEPLWKKLDEEGLLIREEDAQIHLTGEGRLVADRIAVEILEAFDTGAVKPLQV